MKTSPIKIVKHPVTGAIVTQNPNKKDFGKIMVEQVIDVINGTYLTTQKRVAFIGGDYNGLVRYAEQKAKEGNVIVGNIIRQESDTPFYPNQTAVQYPANSERAGEVVLHKSTNAPYYLQFVIDENPNNPTTVWVGSKATAEVTQLVEETAGN